MKLWRFSGFCWRGVVFGMCLLASAGLWAQSQTWVQRYDLRRKVDGVYQGLHYGRNQGGWRLDGASGLIRDDFFSVRSLADPRKQDLELDQRVRSGWVRCGAGVLAPAPDAWPAGGSLAAGAAGSRPDSGPPEPWQAGRFETDWAFNPEHAPEGSTWMARLLFCLFPDRPDSQAWLLPQDASFRNHGRTTWLGHQVWDIRGGTTLRLTRLQVSDYQRWPALEPLGRQPVLPGVTSLGGRREIRILVDCDTLAPVYLQEKVDAQTVAMGGKKYQLDGVLMTFFDDPSGDLDGRIRQDEALLRTALQDSGPGPRQGQTPGSPTPSAPAAVAALPSPTAPAVPPTTPPVASADPRLAAVPASPAPSAPAGLPADPSPAVVAARPAPTPPAASPVPPAASLSPPSPSVPPQVSQLQAEDDIAVRSSPGGLVLEIPDLGFVADQAVLVPGEEARLLKLAKVLAGLEDVTFLVRGHTAKWGSVQVQESLAVDRARLVCQVLKSAGVDPGRLMFEGCGAREPRAGNDTPAGRALNRRVEIVLVRGPGAGERP